MAGKARGCCQKFRAGLPGSGDLGDLDSGVELWGSGGCQHYVGVHSVSTTRLNSKRTGSPVSVASTVFRSLRSALSDAYGALVRAGVKVCAEPLAVSLMVIARLAGSVDCRSAPPSGYQCLRRGAVRFSVRIALGNEKGLTAWSTSYCIRLKGTPGPL